MAAAIQAPSRACATLQPGRHGVRRTSQRSVLLRADGSLRTVAKASVRFEVQEGYPLPADHVLSIVGSAQEIGAWKPDQSLTLKLAEGQPGLWVVDTTLEGSPADVEFKVVRGPARSNSIAWESIPNRTLQVPAATTDSLHVSCEWNVAGSSIKVVPVVVEPPAAQEPPVAMTNTEATEAISASEATPDTPDEAVSAAQGTPDIIIPGDGDDDFAAADAATTTSPSPVLVLAAVVPVCLMVLSFAVYQGAVLPDMSGIDITLPDMSKIDISLPDMSGLGIVLPGKS